MSEQLADRTRRRDDARAAQLPAWAEMEEPYPHHWIAVDRRDGGERILGESATRSGAVDAALRRLQREDGLIVDWEAGNDE